MEFQETVHEEHANTHFFFLNLIFIIRKINIISKTKKTKTELKYQNIIQTKQTNKQKTLLI